MKKENENIIKYLDLTREIKEILEHENDSYANCSQCAWNSRQSIRKGNGGNLNQRKNRGHPNYNIADIHQNTKTSPGNLRRLPVYQTLVKKHQPRLV